LILSPSASSAWDEAGDAERKYPRLRRIYSGGASFYIAGLRVLETQQQQIQPSGSSINCRNGWSSWKRRWRRAQAQFARSLSLQLKQNLCPSVGISDWTGLFVCITPLGCVASAPATQSPTARVIFESPHSGIPHRPGLGKEKTFHLVMHCPIQSVIVQMTEKKHRRTQAKSARVQRLSQEVKEGGITIMNNTNINRLAACICKLSTRLELKRRSKSALLAGLVTLAVVATPSGANAQRIPFTPVEECGTVIGAPGSYTLTQNLVSSSAVMPCIEITSPGVLFTLEDHTITGPGGVHALAPGIRIFASASGVQMVSSGATIQGFNIGILNEASGVSITGNTQGLTVTRNSAQGILITNASSVVIENLNSTDNGAAGLELSHATGVILQGTSFLQGNAGHGLWLHSSSGNQFFGLESADNKLAGIYVGEPANIAEQNEGLASETERAVNARSMPRSWSPTNRPASATVGNSAPSQDNIFIRGAAIQNGGPGIAIGSGDYHNIVVNMSAQSNKGKDAVDENGSCGGNKWLGNEFAETDPDCIQ